MATDVASVPVNGNYAPHQGYGGIESGKDYSYYSAASVSAPSQPPPTSTTPATNTASTQASSSSQPAEVSKDEVGWYFVEQYYTTLSRKPENLYKFYSKKSQFVSGLEADKVDVCVGQRAINDKITQLDFQQCKVRVTNVDSQASDANIVIQVIGEISNKSQPHKKFVQTFILATQPNGYFLLNDIFRYLVDEEDEPEPEVAPEPAGEAIHDAAVDDSGYQEPVPTVTDVEPKTLTSSLDPEAVEHDAQQVDRELEEFVQNEPEKAEETSEPAVNGVAEPEPEVQEVEDAPAAVVAPEPATVPKIEEPAVEEEPEKPAEPESNPAASPPKQTTPQPAPAAKPPAPKTWASLAASANRVATPNTPSPASSATSQAKATPPSGKTAAPASTASAAPVAPSASAVPTAPAAQREESPASGSQDEWTAVGGNHNRQQSRQINPQQQDPPQHRGFIRNVHEGVDGAELKARLEEFGELVYFDINRQKNSAFVEFKTAEGYNSAVNANPHTVSGERVIVEERKYRPGSTPYVPRGQFQGGRGRGGPNQGAPRGNYGGRGGSYMPRGGRGGAPAPRGRGGSTQAAA